jgi:hypothetical protein
MQDAGVADDVPGDQRGGAVAQHVPQQPGRSLREGPVDLLGRDVTGQDGSEVGEGPVLDRDADCDAVEPARQLGETWPVVMNPLTRPKESFRTLAIGATQLVVQDAAEITSCWSGS